MAGEHLLHSLSHTPCRTHEDHLLSLATELLFRSLIRSNRAKLELVSIYAGTDGHEPCDSARQSCCHGPLLVIINSGAFFGSAKPAMGTKLRRVMVLEWFMTAM